LVLGIAGFMAWITKEPGPKRKEEKKRELIKNIKIIKIRIVNRDNT